MWHVTCGPTFSQSQPVKQEHHRWFKKHLLHAKDRARPRWVARTVAQCDYTKLWDLSCRNCIMPWSILSCIAWLNCQTNDILACELAPKPNKGALTLSHVGYMCKVGEWFRKLIYYVLGHTTLAHPMYIISHSYLFIYLFIHIKDFEQLHRFVELYNIPIKKLERTKWQHLSQHYGNCIVLPLILYH